MYIVVQKSRQQLCSVHRNDEFDPLVLLVQDLVAISIQRSADTKYIDIPVITFEIIDAHICCRAFRVAEASVFSVKDVAQNLLSQLLRESFQA